MEPPPTSTMATSPAIGDRPASTPRRVSRASSSPGEQAGLEAGLVLQSREELRAVRRVAHGAGGRREAHLRTVRVGELAVAAHDRQGAADRVVRQPVGAVDAGAEPGDLEDPPHLGEIAGPRHVGDQEPRRVGAHVDHRDAHQRGNRTSRSASPAASPSRARAARARCTPASRASSAARRSPVCATPATSRSRALSSSNSASRRVLWLSRTARRSSTRRARRAPPRRRDWRPARRLRR